MTISKSRFLAAVGDFVETTIISVAIFFAIYLFIVQPHQVNGHSMDPTFNTGEYLLTEKVNYYFNQPVRGEIIVFKAPSAACIGTNCDYIKRIIALPGETVQVKDGSYYVNGELLAEPYLPTGVTTSPGAYTADERVITLSDNQYFVSGDNRAGSSDSRFWGPITRDAIIGRAFFSYWPISALGLVQHAQVTD